METLLVAFSLLSQHDIEKMGDKAAFEKLLELLRLQNTHILSTRNGPMFHALLTWFGFIAPFENQERLDAIDPELVCEALVELHRFRYKLSAFLKSYECNRSDNLLRSHTTSSNGGAVQ